MNSKLPKAPKTTLEDDNDRLSVLHDSILSHILCFLPTKYAVATSILSTRWKDVFTFVPNIDLDDSLLFVKRPLGDATRKNMFIDFVNRVLFCYKMPYVNEFRLKCYMPAKCSVLNSWIHSVLWRNVQVLDVWVKEVKDGGGLLPSEVFENKMLVVLKFCGNFIINFPESFCLPNLKVLHLGHLKLVFDDSALRFSAGFPLLEDLRIDHISLPNYTSLDISVPSLRRLAIIDSFMLLWCYHIIDTPDLEYFEYVGCRMLQCTMSNLKSLVRANIWVLGPSPSVSPFIRMIRNVKFLRLSGPTMEGLFNSGESLPRLVNLIQMELGAHKDYQWRLLKSLLECSPNLEILDFDMGHSKNPNTRLEYSAIQSQPVCLAKRLREVKIRNFGGYPPDFELVRYILQHGAVLDNMYLHASEQGNSRGWPSEDCEKILMFPRCSKGCKIAFRPMETCGDCL